MLWVMSGNLCKQSDFPVLIWVPLLERIWKYNLQHMLTHLIKFVGTFKSSIFRVFKWFWSMLMETHYSAQKINYSHREQDAILERDTIKKITEWLNVNYIMIMPSYWQRIYIPEHILRKLLAYGGPSCFLNCTFQVSRPFYWQIKFVTLVTVNHPQRPLKAWIRVFFQHQVNNRWWSDRLCGSLSTIHSCYYWQWRGVYNSPSGEWDPDAWCLGQDALVCFCHKLARRMSTCSPQLNSVLFLPGSVLVMPILFSCASIGRSGY